MPHGRGEAPRAAVIVGSYLSGKTTLLESLLHAAGAIPRRGAIKDGNTVGDSSAEARARQMSVETNVAHATYLGDRWTFIDTPGSIEFAQDALAACMAADVAIVVAEPDPARAVALTPILKFLDDHAVPHMVFVNKMDQATVRVRDLLSALQAVSARPLALRQVPIRDGGEAVTGYVDLVSERAYRYKPGEPSDLIQIPEEMAEREKEARNEMLETLADFDDALLEQLLEDAVPPPKDIYQHLTKTLEGDLLVPVFLGSAEQEGGVRRLLKALRHETPSYRQTAEHRGIAADGEPIAQVFKTVHAAHTGKLSYVRVWRGSIKDGSTLNGERVSGVYHLMGATLEKAGEAAAGDVVAFGRMDGVQTGQALTPSGKAPEPALPWPARLDPVYALALAAANRNDEVKLSGALHKLVEEDPSLVVDHSHDTNELVLWGQGEMHLKVAVDRLASKFNLTVETRRPQVPYKETIRRSVDQHARHKKQTGGHGQFGDVKVTIRPLPRGGGFAFEDAIVGGAIPRNYIPAVEEGVRNFMDRGPLGFQVVDIAVKLYDGGFHAVDSSDMAFKTAARMAMSEGMPKCDPVLLEPILHVTVSVPNDATSKVQRMFTGRRGQILGYDAKEGWPGWDEVTGYVPQSEMHDFIIELRSVTMGVGTFAWKFDHLAELTGRIADQVVGARREAAMAS